MLIIDHRDNDAKSSWPNVEIDMHINKHGGPIVKHDPDEPMARLTRTAADFENKKVFIDIKQNLKPRHIETILGGFKRGQVVGLFDVPFPSAYYIRQKVSVPIYMRVSEFEPVNRGFSHFWLDPLVAQTPSQFARLLKDFQPNHKVIFASPELHGATPSEVVAVWRAFKEWPRSWYKFPQIVGVVTKFPALADDFFNND